MKKIGLLAFLFFAPFLAAQPFAQTAMLDEQQMFSVSKEEKAFDVKDWYFASDTDKYILYIDFENVFVNINQIVVKDESGEVIFQENVSELPTNTIYELDMKRWGLGKYELVLQTHSQKAIHHNFQIK